MKKYGKALIVALAGGIIAFLVSYHAGYHQLLAQQPRPDGTLPPNFTSNPPEAAAIAALFWGVTFFVIGFVATLILQRLGTRLTRR